MFDLRENMVLQYTNQENKKLRIIWFNNGYPYLYYIKLDSDTAMPQAVKVEDFLHLIQKDELVAIPDPYGYTYDIAKLPMEYIVWRDKMIEVINFLWFDEKYKILAKESRGKLIDEARTIFGKSNRQIRRILTRYWQRGMVPNALIPDYMNSGGAGKMKSSGVKKRGRRPEYSDVEDGKNIDNEMLEIIRISARLYYSKRNKYPIKFAYDEMNKNFFSDMYISGGKKKYIVQKKHNRPTYRQFYYWLNKELDVKETYISRCGKKSFELHLRELLRDSTSETFGPGSVYQIDATIADVYLVSMSDRRCLIGRPVVYIVMDVYSRLITGFFAGLEGPSWRGAMMALDNVVEDKVKFCRRYGIEITENDWPNSYLPETIIADRGEFEGYNPENLINNLGVRVQNTPPFRGDLKGIVERYFRTMNEKVKHMTPGGVLKEYLERGDRDQKFDAILDLNDFTKLIIQEIIRHNKSVISNYPREEGLRVDEIAPIPIEIYNWGCKNRACGFKFRERDIISLNLLYKEEATILREGIHLPGKLGKLYYSCEEALQEQWFITRKKEKIDIVYDPNNMNCIYIPNDRGNQFIKCSLLEKCCSYSEHREEEVIFDYDIEKELIEELRDEQSQIDVNFIASAEDIIEDAKAKTRKFGRVGKRTKSKDMKENRRQEKNQFNKEQSIELGCKGESINFQPEYESPKSEILTKESRAGLKLSLVKEARKKRNV